MKKILFACFCLLFLCACGASAEITLRNADGEVLAAYTPEKAYQCVLLSTEALALGEHYVLSAGTESEELTLEQAQTALGTSMPSAAPGSPFGMQPPEKGRPGREAG